MVFRFLLLSLFLGTYANAQTITLNVDGQKFTTISMDDVKKMKTTEVEFFNHVTKRAELYKGIPTLSFIEKLYPDLGHILEIEMISANDYLFIVSMSRLQRENSILAFERADGDKFVRYSQKEKILIPLGPLYLVWDLKHISAADRLTYVSTYQISEINLLTKKNRFGVDEDTSDAAVLLGYQNYKVHCISCHAIGKVGGKVSFDLVKRDSVEAKGHDYIKKYILDPQSLNPKTKMLPFPKHSNNSEIAEGIIEFLKFLKNPDVLLNKKKAETSYKALKNIVQEMR